MSPHTEQLAEQFLHANAMLASVAEGCSDAQWQARTDAEGWSVGVAVHHVADDCLDLLDVIAAIAEGRNVPEVTRESLDERNARHAWQSASYSKTETVELLRRNAIVVADTIRHLTDGQLARSGVVLGREASIEQIVTVLLPGHIESHLASIRRAIERAAAAAP
ncbi:MAG: DinB family protein [Dehalococcoidia bacterium]